MNFRNVPTVFVPFLFAGVGYLLYWAFMALQFIVIIGLIIYFVRKLLFNDEK